MKPTREDKHEHEALRAVVRKTARRAACRFSSARASHPVAGYWTPCRRRGSRGRRVAVTVVVIAGLGGQVARFEAARAVRSAGRPMRLMQGWQT